MKFIFKIIVLFCLIIQFADSSPIRINSNINLPKDSIEKTNLIASLNEFLTLTQKPIDENKLVLESEKLETNLLINYLNDVEKSTIFKNDNFYKPYLTNLVNMNDSTYLVQLSYIGVNSDSAYIRISFRLLAHKVSQKFLFSSLLLANSAYWKTDKIHNITFKYKDKINKEKVTEFGNIANSYDKKLKCESIQTEYYCFNDIFEMQSLLGIDYYSAENSAKYSVTSAYNNKKKIILLGNNKSSFESFDPHDLWHDRMSLVLPRSKANRPVDEGCAYLYGGSWGITWKEIFSEFQKQIANNKNTNWKEIKENPIYFKTKDFSNSADFIVNALLVKKIEADNGFSGVWELLNVGPFEKGNEKYYKVLEKLTGITKDNYNDKIWELIKKEE